MNTRALVLFVGASFLSGCSVFSPGGDSDFACPGMPKGVVCKTPRQVYTISTEKQAKKSSGSYKPGVVEVRIAKDGFSPEPIPVLEQARVMRGWIAPWKDSNGDLHWPGVIFTQMHGRQWSVGENDFNGVEPPVPHRMASSAPPMMSGGKGGVANKESTQVPAPSSADVLN